MSKNSNLRKQIRRQSDHEPRAAVFSEKAPEKRTRRNHEERKLRENRLSAKSSADNNSRQSDADIRTAEIHERFGQANELARNAHGDQRHMAPGQRPEIDEIMREATAGGVIFRITKHGDLEIVMIEDKFHRWTIPKGHIEEGETAQETAIREIGEEAGLHELEPIAWLGKINFRYRRENALVLMSTQIYLFRALGDTDQIQKEDWMTGIRWFRFDEAVDLIAYEDIAKLMLLAKSRLRSRGLIE
ncbi:MAG: NUDIX domain-containing protein [Candidatus Nanoperiomorbaceae bacterium]